MTILAFNRIPKVLNALDGYKDLIQQEKMSNVCVIYQNEHNEVEVDVLGYEPNVEMVGMMYIATKLIEESV